MKTRLFIIRLRWRVFSSEILGTCPKILSTSRFASAGGWYVYLCMTRARITEYEWPRDSRPADTFRVCGQWVPEYLERYNYCNTRGRKTTGRRCRETNISRTLAGGGRATSGRVELFIGVEFSRGQPRRGEVLRIPDVARSARHFEAPPRINSFGRSYCTVRSAVGAR